MPLIDIEHIVKEKVGDKHLPPFVLSYLKRITHEEEMNAFLRTHGELRDFDFIRAFLSEGLGCTCSIHGIENISQSHQPLVFVSNHPLGGADGMIISLMLHDGGRQHLRIIVNDLLMNMTPLRNLFVPVNKVGKQSREYVSLQQQLWQSENDILTFPSGACSRKQQGGIRDPKWQHSFIRHAVQSRRDIVPIYFDGQNSSFFYFLALWRKRLGVRVNIEMLYLIDEMYKSKGKHFSVHVGKPISYTTFSTDKTPAEWAEYMYQKVYHLCPAR